MDLSCLPMVPPVLPAVASAEVTFANAKCDTASKAILIEARRLILPPDSWRHRTGQIRVLEGPVNVRLGSISTELGLSGHVRFPAVSDRTADIAGGPFRAMKRLMHHRKPHPYSISCVQPPQALLPTERSSGKRPLVAICRRKHLSNNLQYPLSYDARVTVITLWLCLTKLRLSIVPVAVSS
jgi:hypothetical protein